MTTAKLIGRETAKSRLIYWHRARIARGFPLMVKFEQELKLNECTGNLYSAASTAKICKEYDEVFSADQSAWTADDESTLESMGIAAQ